MNPLAARIRVTAEFELEVELLNPPPTQLMNPFTHEPPDIGPELKRRAIEAITAMEPKNPREINRGITLRSVFVRTAEVGQYVEASR